jgi:multiple sugar transport system substrate-binding protein
MIENVAKSVRRKETVDDAYMRQLEKDITSLYRLDRLTVDTSGDTANSGAVTDSKTNSSSSNTQTASGESSGGASSDNLPAASKALLIILCLVWILLAAYGICMFIKKSKKNHS